MSATQRREQAATRRGARAATKRSARMRSIIAGAAAVLVALAVALPLLWPRAADVREVEVAGTTFTTNLDVREEGGYVYAYLPVNADVGAVVLTAENPDDTARIREFLQDLDTLVPGEHVIDLTDSHLHVIVDGIPDAR